MLQTCNALDIKYSGIALLLFVTLSVENTRLVRCLMRVSLFVHLCVKLRYCETKILDLITWAERGLRHFMR